MNRERIEEQKYREVWTHPEYRRHSYGAMAIERPDLNLLKYIPYSKSSFLDFGCGTGKFWYSLNRFRPNLRIAGFDIAANCLDDAAKKVPHEFYLGCAWNQNHMPKEKFNFVMCSDVMEHIPEEYVEDTLGNIRDLCAEYAYFGISLRKDSFGQKLVGEPLHLTIKNSLWWVDRVQEAGFIVFREIENGTRLHLICDIN